MGREYSYSTDTVELEPAGEQRAERKHFGPTDLRPALSERHVNMIAFSATVGIGLFLQSGKVIYLIGPGGAVIAYLIMGSILWACIASLGEMTAVFPVKGPIIDFPSRYLDEGIGFATGWMAWYAYLIVLATEVTAVSQLFNFEFAPDYLESVGYPQKTLGWNFGQDTSAAIWVGIFLVCILLINLLPVRAYGELEYIFGCFKMVVISGIILFNVIINTRNVSKGITQSRFQYYSSPYGFFSANTTTSSSSNTYTYTGDTGRLVGMWSAMSTIFFSLQGFFTVAITAPENKDLDRDESIKLASRKISLRVILLYSLVVFTAGLNVPYDDVNLRDYSINSIRRGEYSALMVSLVRSRVTGWPHFLNAFFIFSAFSTGINALYISSRLLHALASLQNVWPNYPWAHAIKRRLEKTNGKGVPMMAVFVSWSFGLLGFLSVKASPAQILGRMANNSSASMLIVYACVCSAFLSYKRRTVNGEPSAPVVLQTDRGEVLNRNAQDYPYKSHGQWLRAAYGLCACVILALFNGWRSFLKPFSPPDFIASYISVLVFVVLVAAYHVKDEHTWNPLAWSCRATMDIANPLETREKDVRKRKGRLEIDDDDLFSKQNAKNLATFVWTWLK